MSTKTRSKLVPADSWYSNARQSITGEYYLPEPGNVQTIDAYDGLEETIVSEDGRHNKMHPCTHYKVERNVVNRHLSNSDTWVNPSVWSQGRWEGSKPSLQRFWSCLRYTNQVPSTSGQSAIGEWCQAPLRVAPLLCSYGTDGKPIFNRPADSDELRIGAVEAMIPKIKAEAGGLAEDLIQARQLGTVLNTVQRLKTAFRSLQIGSSASKLITGRSSLAHVTKAVGDAYLQYSFSAAPIYRDVKGVIQSLRVIQKKLHWLRKNEHRVLTGHYRRFLNEDYADIDTSTTYETPTAFVNRECTARCVVTHPIRVYHATMQYRFVTDLDGTLGDQLRGFLDSVGLNLNPAILWNLIPFSFLVDWVVNVSSWLDQFKKTVIDILVLPIQFCDSFRVVRHSFAYVGEVSQLSAFNVREEAYDRKVWALSALNDTQPIKTGELTLLKVSLLAALGITLRR